MWRRIELRNYRSIEHVCVDLAPFTVLVGPNGGGKSNFVDALVFVRDVATDAEAAVERRGGIVGLRRWSPRGQTAVEIDVRLARSQEELGKDFIRHAFTIHSGRQGSWRFEQEHIEVFSRGKQTFLRERRGDELMHFPPRLAPDLAPTASLMLIMRQLGVARTRQLQSVRRLRPDPEAIRQPQLSADNDRVEEGGIHLATALRNLAGTAAYEQVVRTMQRIVPGLRSLGTEQLGRYLTIKFMQEQRRGHEAEFLATEMSDGALRALAMVVAAQQVTEDELLIIEEPEAGIHPGAAQLLFELLKQASERGAVLLTTHSAELLDAARDEEILVCQYRDGVTRIGPLASAQREVVRDGLFTVAELMRSEPLRIEGEPLRSLPPVP